MIQKRSLLTLPIALLTLATLGSSLVLYAQSRISGSTTKWEYMVEPSLFTQSSGRNAFLNEQGEKGWELLAVATYPNGNTILYFKRPKP